MSRFFNGQEVELLAPAGNFEIFKEVIQTGADAVYFGGKNFNMRMHRKDFNFTQEEIRQAVEMAHALNKKVYITVNNLLSHEDLKHIEDYLVFLNEVGPDALIVQDVCLIEKIKEMKLDLTIHASVMMNVHNLPMIKTLRNLGVTRIVASREMSLAQIKALHVQTDMEFEYFVHGDMCIAHGAQCTYSGMILGQSSNRGRCMKPCRWGYKAIKDNKLYDTTYPLAVKDMAMYSHIPELIDAGVVSFKIEGRMRSMDYLATIIKAYSEAIDRYIQDPIDYNREQDLAQLKANRNRDLSTAYAFGKPGLQNINRRYEGTGKFYSTGKVFSQPVEEIEMKEERLQVIREVLTGNQVITKGPELTIRVNDYESAVLALSLGVEHIYLSGDTYEPSKPFSVAQIKDLTTRKAGSKIYLALPRMMYEEDFKVYHHYLSQDLGLDGLLITELGAIGEYKHLGLELIGDFSLNVYNAEMAKFYQHQGLDRITLSIESPLYNTRDFLAASSMPVEVIVHGRPAVMYMEHDLYDNTKALAGAELDETHYKEGILYLIDDKGYEHPIYRDCKGRNHMLLTKELAYLPFIEALYKAGATYFRIEGASYNCEELEHIIRLYQAAQKAIVQKEEMPQFIRGEKGYTLGALQFD